MASASSLEAKMADLEQSFILDAPANILRFGIVKKISMQISISGALVNWKDVADELGFTNLEISGHYANFAGSESALRMLNDWIFKRNGKIRDLVRVFLTLELFSCLEDLKEDLEEYAKKSKKNPYEHKDDEGIDLSANDNVNYDSTISSSSTPSSLITREHASSPGSYQDTSYCSSGLESLSSTFVDSSLDSNISSGTMSLQSDTSVDSLPCPYPPSMEPSQSSSLNPNSIDNATTQKSSELSVTSNSNHTSSSVDSKNSPKNPTRPLSQPKRYPSTSLIKESDWPAPNNRDYTRSTSVPHEKIHNTKTKSKRRLPFNRSRSLEPDTEYRKKSFLGRFKKDKKKSKAKGEKKVDSTEKANPKSTDVEVESGVTSVTAQGSYSEEPSTLKPNLSPLIVSEEKAQRPVSSGSEDSLPFSPNTPTSPMGYESGYHSGDNSVKRIYIVCCPEEEEIYQRALKMYFRFSQKGYECHLFASDMREVMEVGRFRYEMQQVIDADFVFLCVSKKLKEVFEVPLRKAQTFKDDDTKGLRHVSDFMMTFFAKDCCNKNGKFMTILLMEDSYDHIPFSMNTYLKYKWPKEEGRMENMLHHRSEIQIPVSDAKIYAPIKVCTPKGVVKASVREDDTKG